MLYAIGCGGKACEGGREERGERREERGERRGERGRDSHAAGEILRPLTADIWLTRLNPRVHIGGERWNNGLSRLIAASSSLREQ
jgi:hypothetical protein